MAFPSLEVASVAATQLEAAFFKYSNKKALDIIDEVKIWLYLAYESV